MKPFSCTGSQPIDKNPPFQSQPLLPHHWLLPWLWLHPYGTEPTPVGGLSHISHHWGPAGNLEFKGYSLDNFANIYRDFKKNVFYFLKVFLYLCIMADFLLAAIC